MTSSILAAIGGVVVLVLVPLVGALAHDEVTGWLPYAGRALLRSAARRLPADQRPRWEEEWLAEHEARADRPVTALMFAVRVRLNARETAGELEASPRASSQRDESPNESAAGVALREAMRLALDFLSYRERRVLELRHGLDGEHCRTDDEIAQIFHITRERVRQIERGSLMKLQSLAEAQKLREVD